MTTVSRRQMLRLGTVGAIGLAGCTGVIGGASEPESPETGARPCDEHVYRSPDSANEGELPWHLYIRNISLSSYPVSISISDRTGESTEAVVSCTATAEAHRQLVFELSPHTRYRVHVALNRPDSTEEARTTVSGWNRVTGTNEALRVSVDNGEFVIQRVHYDRATSTTEGSQ